MNHGITVAQVCIGWALQRGTTVVVKSTSPERQRENIMLQLTDSVVSIDNSVDENSSAAGFMFSEEELREIAGLESGHRLFRPEEWWGDMAMAVFD